MSKQDTASDSTNPIGSVTVQITMAGETQTLTCEPGETVLQAAHRQDVYLPASCGAGYCGTCIAKLAKGTVRMAENHTLGGQEMSDCYVMVCQSLPVTDQIAIEYGF